jgi:hypothetical protein
MNRAWVKWSLLIGGIICLVIAGFLAIPYPIASVICLFAGVVLLLCRLYSDDGLRPLA